MRLVWNSAVNPWQCGRIAVIAAPVDQPPGTIDAEVQEQDRALLLQVSDNLPAEPEAPAWYLANILNRQPSLKPGTARLVERKIPAVIQAIIYDVEQETVCRPEWIIAALHSILTIAREQNFTSLGIPLLGYHHSGLATMELLKFLDDALRVTPQSNLNSVWLMTPDNFDYALMAKVFSTCNKSE